MTRTCRLAAFGIPLGLLLTCVAVGDDGSYSIRPVPTNSSSNFTLELIWDDNDNGERDQGERVLTETYSRDHDGPYVGHYDEPDGGNCPQYM